MSIPRLRIIKITLCVKCLDESLFFYKRLGAEFSNDEEDEFMYADLKFSDGSICDITLKEYFVKSSAPKFCIEVEPEEGFSYLETFEYLIDRGYLFENVDPKTIYSGGVIPNGLYLKDPDDNLLFLVDSSIYQDR